jgi:hypothetical protein
VQDPSHFSDVVCSFCDRHNREVRVVSNDAGLIICQICVAKSAEIFDQWSASTRLRSAGRSAGP